MKRTEILVRSLAIGSVGLLAVGGISIAAAGSISDLQTPTEEEVPTEEQVQVPTEEQVQVAAPADRRVLPAELWDGTLEALLCFQSHGVGTLGPFPLADGSGIAYSFRATEDALEVEAVCTATVEPLSRRFAFDNAPNKTSQPGAPLGAAETASGPATSDALELASLAQDLEVCLVEADVLAEAQEGDAQNGALQTAAQQYPEKFQGCVETVG